MIEEFYQKCMPSWFACDFFVQVYQKGGSSSQVHEKAEDVNEGEVVKKGKVLKKVNNKGRKKGILRVGRHVEVMLSLVLFMREK
jgi:hypothetical protein